MSTEKSVKLTGEEFLQAFKPRRKMGLGWRIWFWVCGTAWVIGAAILILAGKPPNWFTVVGAAWILPAAGWLWDDHLRRKLDRARGGAL